MKTHRKLLLASALMAICMQPAIALIAPPEPIPEEPSVPSEPVPEEPSVPSEPVPEEPSVPSEPVPEEPSVPSEPVPEEPSVPSEPVPEEPGVLSAPLNQWLELMEGIPDGHWYKRPPFVLNGELYKRVMHKDKSLRGLYRLNRDIDVWEQIGKGGPLGMSNVVMDDSGDFIGFSKARKKWGGRFWRLSAGSDSWEQIYEFYHKEEVSEFNFKEIELIDGKVYFKGKRKHLDAKGRNGFEHSVFAFDIQTMQIDNIGFPPYGSGRNHFGQDRYGNLLMSDQWGGRKNKGQYKWDEGGMFRYNVSEGSWEDITRNLDQRNSTNGKCCGPLGNNSQGIENSEDGETIYTRTEHGLWRWNYDNDEWDKLFDAPYGNGAGMISYVDDDKVIFDDRYMEGFAYQELGEDVLELDKRGRPIKNLKAVETDITWLNTDDVRTKLRRMFTFDGETFYGHFQILQSQLITKGKKKGQYHWKKKGALVAKLSRDPDAPKTDFNFTPAYSSYLGGDQNDDAVAVAVNADKEVVVAGNFSDMPSSSAVSLSSDVEGEGRLAVYNAEGQLLRQSILGQKVYDMEVNPNNGNIAVIGDFGVVVLSANASSVLWSDDIYTEAAEGTDLNPNRVSIGRDGSVVTLVGKEVSSYDKYGNLLARTVVDRSYVTDVAVLDAHGKVFVSGFSNNRGTNSRGKSKPVQIAFLHGYRLDNLERTQVTWDYDADTLALTHNMADTRIYRVNKGKDGQLYVVGESAGGNTVFRWNGLDLETKGLVISDPYNHAWNTKSAHIGYVGRINPETAEVEKGQMILARLNSNNRGNTFRARAITADENGVVYIGGTSACCSVARDIRRINGELIGGYKGGESSLLILGKDFEERLMWTPLLSADAETSDQGAIRSIAVGDGVKALVGNADSGLIYTTEDAQQKAPFNPEATEKGEDKVQDSYMMLFDDVGLTSH